MPSHATMFCIGHSHCASLQKASREIGESLFAINFWEHPGSLQKNGERRWLLSKATIAAINNHRGPVFSLIGGASYGVLGMLSHPRKWDFVAPDAANLALDPHAEAIPFGAIRETLAVLMDEYLDIVAQLAAVTSADVHVIEPPPPHANPDLIAPHIPWALYPGMLHEIAPAPLRLKLWRLQSALMREHTHRHQLSFIDCPTESVDERGFMRDEYFLDGAHANARYGALVLAQMRRIHDASI